LEQYEGKKIKFPAGA
jgi:hypothetical protein